MGGLILHIGAKVFSTRLTLSRCSRDWPWPPATG